MFTEYRQMRARESERGGSQDSELLRTKSSNYLFYLGQELRIICSTHCRTWLTYVHVGLEALRQV